MKMRRSATVEQVQEALREGCEGVIRLAVRSEPGSPDIVIEPAQPVTNTARGRALGAAQCALARAGIVATGNTFSGRWIVVAKEGASEELAQVVGRGR